MSLKQLAKQLIPPLLLDAAKQRASAYQKQRYLQHKTPWSPGYDQYKSELIAAALANPSLLKTFSESGLLPTGYGFGVDERCVEYPWTIAHLSNHRNLLLDAGSVLNFEYILAQPILQQKTLHILTLAPEANCFWQRGISYLYADLRTIPIQSNYYDEIVCLSTLEHIGCDNTIYVGESKVQKSEPESFQAAMQELCRVLKPGGSLLLSVPFGAYQHFGSFQQFDWELLQQAIAAFQPAKQVTTTFYRYTKDGWQVATADECQTCEYVTWVAEMSQRGQLPQPIPVDADHAAAARAVACVHLVKA